MAIGSSHVRTDFGALTICFRLAEVQIRAIGTTSSVPNIPIVGKCRLAENFVLGSKIRAPQHSPNEADVLMY